MNFFENELRMMFGDNKIIKKPLIVGRTLTGILDEDLRIKVKITASKVQGEFDTIKAVIINRKSGEVDSQNFLFADIIGMQKRNNGLEPINPHMWDNGNPNGEWYGFAPTIEQRAKIGDTILEYAEIYISQDIQLANQFL